MNIKNVEFVYQIRKKGYYEYEQNLNNQSTYISKLVSIMKWQLVNT